MHRKLGAGFSLLELLFTLAILGILALVAIPAYQQSLCTARLAEARAALLENHQFLQRWQLKQRLTSSAKAQAWPALPVKGTQAFDIKINAAAASFEHMQHSRFILTVIPKHPANWPEIFDLKMDQDGNIRYCIIKQDNEVEQCSVL